MSSKTEGRDDGGGDAVDPRAPRAILHVDMDAFFASVEQQDDPKLRGRPVLVGGPGPRGVVAAASYEARPSGVRSAMPLMKALRLCPEAVVVPPRHGRYVEVSRRVFAVFHRFTPLVEGLSVDEAFLDVSASRRLFGDGAEVARRIKATVRKETGLVASAGVATSKFVAKVASDLDKPDGLVVVPPGEEADFLAPLPIERMWGVGPKAAERLRGLGLGTFGQLVAADDRTLEGLLGRWGWTVRDLAQGVDPRPVVPDREAKSLGAEETFDHDLHRADELRRALLGQARRVAARLTQAGLAGRVVTVKLKDADFALRSRQLRLPTAVSDTDAIYRAAQTLLERFPRTGRGIRLTGVAVSELSTSAVAELFPDADKARREALEVTRSAIEARFGAAGLTRAALLDGGDDRRRGR